jgi:muramidase (phage lysozyme)
MSDKATRYRELLKQPQVRALLNTIRYAEGTPGASGYQTMFGGGKFSDLSRHPDQVVRSGGYSSAAAGAYQFLPGTWKGIAGELGLKKFGPEEQDIAALGLIERRGALQPFLSGAKFGTVMDKLAPEWASLPTAAGQSYYGQPVKQLGDLYKYYEEQKKVPGTVVAQQPAVQKPKETAKVEDLAGQNPLLMQMAQQLFAPIVAPKQSGSLDRLSNFMRLFGTMGQ